MTTMMTCPSCGTVSHLDELARDADCFCRVCDFPLFWSRGERVVTGGEGGAVGLRRLPGIAGRVDVATIVCPACDEPNPFARRICVRCGATLRPAPPPPPPPPPPRPVVPRPVPVVIEPARSWVWLWLLLGLSAAVALAVLVALVWH